jgi:hypothetical protein
MYSLSIQGLLTICFQEIWPDNSMKVDHKIIIENILKRNGITGLIGEPLQNLLDVVQAETFGKKVAIAINQRSQGHFDKAMLNISEANRVQVLSIREIQAIIDRAKAKLKTEVVFEKYRQFYPFQIGLTHGEDVLELLSLIKDECDFDLEELVADLHKNEEMVAPIIEELNFYETKMKGRISEDEISELKKKVKKITKKIFEKKTSIIDNTSGIVQGEYPQIADAHKLILVKNMYLVLSSSIQTLDAKSVEVEQRT